MTPRPAVRVAVAALAVAACTRKAPAPSPQDVDASGASASASATSASSAAASATPPAPPAVLERSPVAAAEARRTNVARFADEPALAGALEPLAKHFAGAAAPAAGFDVQIAPLSVGHRRALLVMEADRPASDARPFVVVTDDRGAVAWTRERPIAGILPPVASAAIAGGPIGRVAIAACDPPTKSVALRLWDDDGSPFADFQVLDVDACDAVSLMFWPRRGWVVVAAGPDVTRARLVTESGSLGWGRGLDLGARSSPVALSPASLAADTDDTFVLVQAVQPSKVPGSPYHALAFRYDAQGAAIWPAAIDLGELGRAPRAGERVSVTRNPPAGVSVAIADLQTDVLPSGSFNRRRPARP